MKQTMLKVMTEQKLNALAYPTLRRKPARIGEPQRGTNCQLSASTGLPAISFPGGFTDVGCRWDWSCWGRSSARPSC